jgi:hypothetical protein
MTWWKRDRVWDLTFVFVATVMVIVRFRILREGGAPPTIDAGDWIAHGDAIFGSGIRSTTIVYPPLVPTFTKVLVELLGFTNGVSLMGAVAAAAPAVGLYGALRLTGSAVSAIGSGLLLLAAGSIGEAAAWGGFPQLLGLGIAPLALLMFDSMLRSWTRRDALLAGVALAALLSTSHFIAAVVAIAIVALLLMRLLERNLPPLRDVLRGFGLMVLPILWLVPLYATLLDAFSSAGRDFRFFNELTASTFWDQLEFLYRDLAWVWRPLIVAALLAPLALMRHRSSLWRTTTALTLAVVLILLVTREGRFIYFITLTTAMGVALWARHGPAELAKRIPRGNAARIGAIGLTCLLLVTLIQIDSGAHSFHEQRGYYGVLTPDLLIGIESVAATTTPDAVLAVTSLNDAPFGRWVEAIADRETFYGAPLRWLLFEVDLERSALANDLFIPPFPDVPRVREAAAAGIDFILIPTRWVFYDEQALDAFTRIYPRAVQWASSELVVIDTLLP